MSPEAAAILRFLREIGIEAREGVVDGETFLPGMRVESGAIVYDAERLKYPGDLLHEAAHIAFTPLANRSALSDDMQTDAGDEMAAMAWSYAAAVHLDLDPAIVFHAHGYRGEGASIHENFRARRYVGVSMLQWREMTTDAAYPAMTKWLAD